MSEPRRYIRTVPAAEYVALRPQTLRAFRVRGGGPPFIRLSANRCAYDTRDLDVWLLARKTTNTARAVVPKADVVAQAVAP
jgi:hypothetical protein